MSAESCCSRAVTAPVVRGRRRLSTGLLHARPHPRHDVAMDISTIARDGVFDTGTATRLGIDAAALKRLMRVGACTRLRPGWYAAGTLTDERHRWRLLIAAAQQEYAGRAVLSHDAAVLALGLPTFQPVTSRIDLTWLDPTTPAHLGRWVRLHRCPPGVHLGDGDHTVPPAVAVAQSGLRSRRALLVAGDAALRSKTATRVDIDAALAALEGHRGIVAARAVAHLLEPLHESPGESLTAWLLHQLGHRLVPQHEVPGTERLTASGWPDRVDFLVEGTRVVVEFDGKVKYSDRDVLFAEKQREDRIRSLGYEVVRLIWADLSRPERVRTLLQDALARARRRQDPPARTA